ncbi:hypothetical protein Gorai_023036 [Gossypium raimondii]|uniref:RNase H type-1 domain-containing protein n=1 Tax=Gossypium raimondii TaxID=29730 RepID=A0A7J8NUY6_GOSRA|nr:hypothetical protein [Gossypium raimondii]
MEYFQNIFYSKGIGELSHLLSGIEVSIDSEANNSLMVRYTKEEVFSTLKEMGPTKTLKEDDFSALFFRADLIDANNRVRKEDLIINTFGRKDATRILRILLWFTWAIGGVRLTKSVSFAVHFGQFGEITIRGSMKREENQTYQSANLGGKWGKPSGNTMKINFNGAYDDGIFRSASGIVAMNVEGAALCSRSEVHDEVASAFAAEAIACQKAVEMGSEMGWKILLWKGIHYL